MPTNRELFMKKYNIPPGTTLNIEDISRISKVPTSIIDEAFSRAKGAWASNIRSVRIKGSFKKDPDLRKFPRSARLTPEQWGYGRIFSLLMGGKTATTADSDLAKKIEDLNRK